ncbi:PepSY-associated TM helix domain-containing protein [Sphingomonas sp. ERG5]|uniref:PepSY-associated TM helix domain-containing protein n=1 Tax=Sphingomonas sp. ERG5 TaxID=1381597 RepID=UPI00054C39D5|nr:PepSY-associated TM helix domain-containing protein [Sphingomonas sp. ERG5]
MKTGFRQSMAGLHTWSGLLLGWLLFVMFACGSAAYFQEEITRWMQPEVIAAPDQASAVNAAQRWLARRAPNAPSWFITVPGKRSAVTQLYWEAPEGAAPDTPTEAQLDGTGREVTARATAGGYFLYRFHYDLHYLPVIWARYLVGVAAMFMLVAILSGIVTHKKIFIDFFLLRFGKGQRSWLDAHNVTAVLALPFHLMITYTGLVSLASLYVPAPIAAAYPDEAAYYAEAFPQPVAGAKSGPAPLAPLAPMMAAARRQWHGAEIGYISVTHPGDRTARVAITSSPSGSMDTRGETVSFDGLTGRPLAAAAPRGAARLTEGVMIGLHAGRYADMPLRWLYFVSGLFGTAMIATGLVLWTVKRRTRLPDPARPYLGFLIVERLNIGVVTGFPLAIAGYFLANRLLPVDLAARPDREILALFVIWGAALGWAVLRPAARGWIELSAACALAFAAVPLVSATVTGRGLPASLMAGDAMFVAFDSVMLLFAGGFGALAWILAKRRRRAA